MTTLHVDSAQVRLKRVRQIAREALLIGAGGLMAVGLLSSPAGAASTVDIRPTTGLRPGSVVQVTWSTDAADNVVIRQCAVDSGLHCETRTARWVVSNPEASQASFTVRSAINDGTSTYPCDEESDCVVQVGFDVDTDGLGTRSQWLDADSIMTAALSFDADGASGSSGYSGSGTSGSSTTGSGTTGSGTTGSSTTGSSTTGSSTTGSGTSGSGTTGSGTSGSGTSGGGSDTTAGSSTAGGSSDSSDSTTGGSSTGGSMTSRTGAGSTGGSGSLGQSPSATGDTGTDAQVAGSRSGVSGAAGTDGSAEASASASGGLGQAPTGGVSQAVNGGELASTGVNDLPLAFLGAGLIALGQSLRLGANVKPARARR
ncbi:MAG: hypothetical protein H6512_06765 [Acidimicrobiia bacterium]|nr:hypothetical protein [Acidimicrobiia bacterium]